VSVTRFEPQKPPENAQNPTRQVHLGRMRTSYFTKETGAQWEYTARWQTNKPYVSIGESQRLPWCTVVADHDDLSTGDALSDPD
jgi:hypothetical protein